MLAWVFKKAKIDVSYMFGGICKNNFPSLNFGNSEYSILEGDESINGLDQQAKFLYYPVKYLILTSASFEHKESYKNEKENSNAFKKLIEKVPQDGLIIANKSGENISKLLKYASAPIVYYDNDNENAVIALCKHLKINISNSLTTFPGIKRRIELISNKNNILIFDDFAQSPDRIAYVINTLNLKFPKYKIKILLEPHASHLQYSISGLGFALNKAKEVILSKIKYNQKIDKRITFKDYQKEIGNKLKYIPLESDIIKHYQSSLKEYDLLIRFSSSGNNICQNI
jgi:UDP-N-acetylmuramate: L-alanyl-gamma-D-glutamyl-meso-diaminopimelate ligase